MISMKSGYINGIVPLVLLLVTLLLFSCEPSGFPTGNFWIVSIDVDPDYVYVNSEVTLTAFVENPDNEELVYDWRASGGTIYGSGNQVQWMTPPDPASYTIELWVRGESGEDYERKVIEVHE